MKKLVDYCIAGWFDPNETFSLSLRASGAGIFYNATSGKQRHPMPC
jgi:hypothetical protein